MGSGGPDADPAGWRKYLSFAEHFGFAPVPPSAVKLLFYIAAGASDSARFRRAPGTTRTHLRHIEALGLGSDAFRDNRLQQSLFGHELEHQPIRRPQQEGISPQLCAEMLTLVGKTSPTDRALRAALAICSLNATRPGEITWRGARDGAPSKGSRPLARKDASWPQGGGAIIVLPRGKTKLAKKPIRVVHAGTPSALRELERAVRKAPKTGGKDPLLQDDWGRPYHYRDFLASIKYLALLLGRDPVVFGGRSGRIGGTSAAVAAGASDRELERLGRWVLGSDMPQRHYARVAHSKQIGLTKAMIEAG